MSAVRLHQHLVQALDVHASTSQALLQIPHIQSDHLKSLHKKIYRIRDFLRLSPDNRHRSLDGIGLDDRSLRDIDEFVAVAPRVELSNPKIFVVDEEHVCMGDVATLQVTFTRLNCPEGSAVGAAHTPYLSDATAPERWWLFLILPRRNVQATRIESSAHEITVQMRFMVASVGRCHA